MRTAPALLIVLAATIALTGCQPDDSPLVVDPSPSVTPIFESDEEALAAAEAAYAEYLAVIDQIHMDGGKDPDRLREVAVDPVLSTELQGFVAFSERDHKTVGSTTYDTVTLQQYDPGSSVSTVMIYVCEDFTGTDILGPDDVSVVGPQRQLRWPLVVGFDVVDDELRVSTVDDWTGEDFCV